MRSHGTQRILIDRALHRRSDAVLAVSEEQIWFLRDKLRVRPGILHLVPNGVDVGHFCLLYTSDAADERSSVDLGGSRIIKKKKKHTTRVIHGMLHNNKMMYTSCSKCRQMRARHKSVQSD